MNITRDCIHLTRFRLQLTRPSTPAVSTNICRRLQSCRNRNARHFQTTFNDFTITHPGRKTDTLTWFHNLLSNYLDEPYITLDLCALPLHYTAPLEIMVPHRTVCQDDMSKNLCPPHCPSNTAQLALCGQWKRKDEQRRTHTWIIHEGHPSHPALLGTSRTVIAIIPPSEI